MAWMFIPLQTLGTSVKAAGQTQHGDNFQTRRWSHWVTKDPVDGYAPSRLGGAKPHLRSYGKVDSERSFLTECRNVLFWTTPFFGPGPQALRLGCSS